MGDSYFLARGKSALCEMFLFYYNTDPICDIQMNLAKVLEKGYSVNNIHTILNLVKYAQILIYTMNIKWPKG